MFIFARGHASRHLRRKRVLGAWFLALLGVPTSHAQNGSAVSTFAGGAFNWSNTANWTAGIVPNGTGDNANADGLLTLGTGTTGADSYNFTGTLGGNAFTTGAGNENSRFDVTKIGAGTQKFSGTALHTGTNTINAGTLLINGTHAADTSTSGNLVAIATRGDYIVNSGSTLGGTGTIKPYNTAGGSAMITIAAGGTLAPGDTNVNYATGYGGLAFGSAYTGTTHSGTAISGGLLIGTGLAHYAGAQLFLVDNDIYLNVTAVPEPSTYAFIAGGVALGLAIRRRRAGKKIVPSVP